MKTANFPAVVAAKKAASTQLNYYRTMMAPAESRSGELNVTAAARKAKAKPSGK